MNDLAKENGALILAAGRSVRMSEPKMMLAYNRKYRFLEYEIMRFRQAGLEKIVVVVNNNDYVKYRQELIKLSPVQFVVNNNPENGRFFSLKIGLQPLVSCRGVFIHNVDTPFVSPEILRKMTVHSGGFDFVVPRFEGRGGHPVLVNNTVVKDIVENARIKSNLKEVLKKYKRCDLDVPISKILLNINTPEEYRRFRINNSY